MKQTGEIILASNSPRRKNFLEILGLRIRVIPSHIEEPLFSLSPKKLTLRVTREKVREVRNRLGQSFRGWLIGADTIVVLKKEILGKPKNRKEAEQMLSKISGKGHRVFTAFRVEKEDGTFIEKVVQTKVTMAPMSKEQIRWYVQTGEPDDKAGAYAIQGLGGMFVRSISGSYSNVVGLPLFELIEALRKMGVLKD